MPLELNNLENEQRIVSVKSKKKLVLCVCVLTRATVLHVYDRHKNFHAANEIIY
jgi:hypothetical protein